MNKITNANLAYNHGHKSAKLGFSVSTNPYAATKYKADWLRGHADGRKAESCSDLLVQNEVVEVYERGNLTSKICRLAPESASFFACVCYDDGQYSGYTTWDTQEQARNAAQNW